MRQRKLPRKSRRQMPELCDRCAGRAGYQRLEGARVDARRSRATDGKISMPLLNDVQAAARTPLQLAADITAGTKKS